MFIHHVFFTLKNPNSTADKTALMEGLNTLIHIETIKMSHIGVPASTDRDVIDRSYSVSWLLVFDNIEAEEVYQIHPLHQKFIEKYSHLWSKVIVFDAVNA